MAPKNSRKDTRPGEELSSLESELNALRSLLREALDRAEQGVDEQEEKELRRLMVIIDSLSRSAARLGRLEAMQRAAEAGSGSRLSPETQAVLRQALETLRRESQKNGGENGSP